jgi:N-acylneuraminate cytidylyltransferase
VNICALQTARAGSQSVLNKNKLEIEGKPLFLYNACFALRSRFINELYISTDDPDIKNMATKQNIQCIDRPVELCGDKSHYDVIKHGLLSIESTTNNKVDILVILLGNNKGAYNYDLDISIKLLMDNDYDSIMSLSKYNMFNPIRAFIKKDNMINTFIDQQNIKNMNCINKNDKNAFGDVYFFNGSFWICKRQAIIDNNGLEPYPWLGNKIYPFIQKEGIMEIDQAWQIDVLKNKWL